MRVLSGMQPTGIAHLGNYFGAFANWVKLQEDGNDCFYFIANQHAITVPQDGEKLKKQTFELAATYLAVGLDPEKSTLFIQSDVPEHLQLAWVLTSLAPMGQMERMTQFKEKSTKQSGSASLGLFSYPVLQAADVLLYKTDVVPVGIDQAQHLELTRDLAQKFNNRYGKVFPEPKTLHTQTKKVVGLDGKSKMSKSYNNYIGLTEDSKTLWSKIAPSVTDPSRIKKTDPGNPNICNIHSLHKLISSDLDIKWSAEGCTNATIGCIQCKKKLYENVETLVEPIREKYKSLMDKPHYIKEVLEHGAKKASAVAKKTINEVYNLVGF
ncbi:MAG: tryptophan--tRNA ligase [Alphaproteobacteria bacterium]